MDKNTVCDFVRARFEPGSGRRQKLRERERERENLETGRNSTESLLQCPQLASFTVPSSGIPATKRVESDSGEEGGRFPFYVLSILILGLVFANQERGEGMRIPRVVGSTVGVLAAKLEILTCEF